MSPALQDKGLLISPLVDVKDNATNLKSNFLDPKNSFNDYINPIKFIEFYNSSSSIDLY